MSLRTFQYRSLTNAIAFCLIALTAPIVFAQERGPSPVPPATAIAKSFTGAFAWN